MMSDAYLLELWKWIPLKQISSMMIRCHGTPCSPCSVTGPWMAPAMQSDDQLSGTWFRIDIKSNQYRKSHCGDYSLYWISHCFSFVERLYLLQLGHFICKINFKWQVLILWHSHNVHTNAIDYIYVMTWFGVHVWNHTTGIPQGSILGPLLFHINLNNISNSRSLCSFILLADDTIYSSGMNTYILQIEISNTNDLLNNEWENLWLVNSKHII